MGSPVTQWAASAGAQPEEQASVFLLSTGGTQAQPLLAGRVLVAPKKPSCWARRQLPPVSSPLQALTEKGLQVDHTYTDLKIALGLGW